MDTIYLYADESGNTGMNLFDRNQPYFYLGTIFSKINLNENKNFKNDFLFLLDKKEELHYNELSLNERLDLSIKILNLIKKYDINAHLSFIEKNYLPKIDFFNIFFDSNTNPFVPYNLYNIKITRTILLATVLNYFPDIESEEFFLLIKKHDKKAVTLFIDRILQRIISKETHHEISELIQSILIYAKKNISLFIDKFNRKKLLPNFWALVQVLGYANNEYSNYKALFHHDFNSNIFKGVNLNLACKLTSKDDDFSKITDIKKNSIFTKTINFIDSKKDYGIQLSDFIVSFTKDHHEGKIDSILFEKFCTYVENLPTRGIGQEFTEADLTNYEKYL